MYKILICGADGMLGTVLSTYLIHRGYEVIALGKKKLDVRNFSKVKDTLSVVRPKILFNLAAITDLEFCEKHPDTATDVNVIGTENLIKSCNAVDCKLVFISTGAVFDGSKQEAYNEDDKPNPLSVYGKTKYWGEQVILKTCKDFLIIRTGWLFGGFEKDKKIVANILKSLLTGNKRILAVNDTYGSPTFANDLAIALERITLSNTGGLYHIVNQGFATRYNIAEQITKSTNITDVELSLVNPDFFKTKYPVKRISNEMLITNKMKEQCINRTWEDALTEYVCRYIGNRKYAEK